MKNFKKYFDTFMCLCLSSLLISSTILSKSDVKALDFDMLGGASFFSTFSSVEKQTSNCTLTPAQYLSRLQSRSTSTANGRKTNKKFKVLNAGKAVALMEEK